ncbi:MAG: hypothetical protein ACI9DC_001233 [Gammaproteobacteria bacterium]
MSCLYKTYPDLGVTDCVLVDCRGGRLAWGLLVEREVPQRRVAQPGGLRRNVKMKARARLVERGAGTGEIDKELRAVDDSFGKQYSDSSHELKVSLGMLEVSL